MAFEFIQLRNLQYKPAIEIATLGNTPQSHVGIIARREDERRVFEDSTSDAAGVGNGHVHDIERNPMIIHKILGCHKSNRDNFALRNSGTHVGLVVKIWSSSYQSGQTL
jgi:hypothetical protein